MHLQVSTSLIDHLFGSSTTSCCLSACCGYPSPRACEEARLLLLLIKECRIQNPADAGTVRDTLPDMLDRWAHGTEGNETCDKCGKWVKLPSCQCGCVSSMTVSRIVQRELCSETSVGLSAWKLHWFTKQALHMLLQHKRQNTAKGSLLLHVPSANVQNVFTLLSLLQAG